MTHNTENEPQRMNERKKQTNKNNKNEEKTNGTRYELH